MASEELLKKLRSAFNLNIYEAKVWLSLLSRGVATAGELSDMSNVPRSRSYDVLESLEKKGFIILKLGRPIKYLAVPPQEVLKRVKKGIREQAEETVKMIENAQATEMFQELDLLFKRGIEHIDPANITGCFRGRKNAYEHIASVIGSAKKEVIIATTTDGLLRKVEHFKGMLRKLSNQGVEVRIAAPLKTDAAKEAAKELAEFAKVKDSNINARFVLVDDKELVFMLHNDKETHESVDTAIWVKSPFFTSSMKSLFDSHWIRR